ncbi:MULTISPECIES: DUF6124 family protein [Pseudomonas]|uniref:DUF6124 family protein n=1 Tax=Pseudomonas TaxID=286 RepID=UPI000641C7C8|nr:MULTISPECIES: hypothetical protein [Pseudomonas]AOZ13609.1 DUF3077 domain-containing protein [Pseudomonas lundensis]KMM87711.1 hypothetical protein TU74_16235 [Pseudomonas lundensis]MBS5841571.1 DUF3077 domain-containing protein [Pseudomonas sp.]MCT8954989.1 DUF3077 domain-containing protein [Pseudomonas lundensis]NLU01938.1 DUF3077 domain-containing protein [Pseudomonas lundensis]
MSKITPDPPLFPLQDAAPCDSQSLDRAAAERALRYYRLDLKPTWHTGTHPYAAPSSVNLEAALAQASDLLRCAGASASEAGNGLSGHTRHLVLSVMHLVELAREHVDKSLDGLTTH